MELTRKGTPPSSIQAVARARRHQHRLAVLFVDLDRFKEINDTLGHDAGDRLLQEVARRLAASVRESDVVARLGGDEFVVMVEHFRDDEDIAVIAGKVVSAASEPYLLEGQELHVTASVGIALYPGDGDDVRSLLKNADIAMYRAKERGRNNFQLYSAVSNPHSLARLTLETQLARALERSELELFFQPTVSLADQLPTSLEALLRWRHPDRGLLLPDEFLPLAEETGLIIPIGRWVLNEACRLSSVWRERGLPLLPVAVNVSARQFLRGELIDEVRGALADHDMTPDMLQFETSESVVMQNPVAAADLLPRLKTIGVQHTASVLRTIWQTSSPESRGR